ncbi:hypothetical protein BDZ97DRAFT_657940 [Flammula alnicola]|nr:hypothetical protein BDZ97DRAFT_657940 [Flammula alnicola]
MSSVRSPPSQGNTFASPISGTQIGSSSMSSKDFPALPSPAPRSSRPAQHASPYAWSPPPTPSKGPSESNIQEIPLSTESRVIVVSRLPHPATSQIAAESPNYLLLRGLPDIRGCHWPMLRMNGPIRPKSTTSDSQRTNTLPFITFNDFCFHASLSCFRVHLFSLCTFSGTIFLSRPATIFYYDLPLRRTTHATLRLDDLMNLCMTYILFTCAWSFC